MNCELYIELMSAALDGECTAEERRALEAHLASCPECAALYEQLRRNAQAARELDCEVPADLKARIMNNLPAQERVKQGKVIRWKRWVPVAAAACLALVVTLVPVGSRNDNALSLSRSGNSAPAPAASSAVEADSAEINNAPASYDGAPAAGSDPQEYSGTLTGHYEVPDTENYGSAGEPSAESSTAPSAEPSAQPSVAPSVPPSPAPSAEPSSTPDTTGGTEPSGGQSDINANGDQAGSGDANIQTGENLDPGLIPGQGQSTGGVVGGSDQFAGEPNHYWFGNQRAIRVSYGATPEPGALVIGSVAELRSYLARFGSTVPTTEFEALLKTYTPGFFVRHRLLCVVVESGSGSNRFELAPQGLYRDAVTVKVTVPEVGTADMAAWLLVAEVDSMFDGGDTLEVVIIH